MFDTESVVWPPYRPGFLFAPDTEDDQAFADMDHDAARLAYKVFDLDVMHGFSLPVTLLRRYADDKARGLVRHGLVV